MLKLLHKRIKSKCKYIKKKEQLQQKQQVKKKTPDNLFKTRNMKYR